MGRLTNIQIKNAPAGVLQDGDGLILRRTADGGRWIYRYSFGGRRRDMGLGSWPQVTLAEARRERDQWAAVKRAGKDPVSERDAEKAEAVAAMNRSDPTFEEMSLQTLEAISGTLRGGGDRGRWISPLRTHVWPKLGKKRMSQIHQQDIRQALAPIWKKMHPTARKAIDRTRIVFRTAMLAGCDCTPDTVDRAAYLLGVVNHTTVSRPALSWQDVPDLYASLGDAPTHLSIKWLILTVVRSMAARGARAGEIEGDVWTVPPDRVKGREGKVQPFRVPLSSEAMRVKYQALMISDDLLFPSTRAGKFVTDVGVSKVLKQYAPDATLHGFRTSFRTWCQDTDACGWEVSETILGHVVGGKVERAYARSDLLERRRPVMEAWAAHVTGAASGVVRIRG